MLEENLRLKSKELKDSITDSVSKFQYETGIVPNIEIKIIQENSAPFTVIRRIIVSVNVEL